MNSELLSPAGSPEKLKYALAYGADAVYAGIPKFSLRAKENPFKDHLLKDAIDYTHKMGKKIYITANILPPNRKIESFKKSLAQHAEMGPDAFIMADPGMIQFALKEFPEIPVHLSVQTNTINWSSVEFWYNLGVKRVILSRELSLEEITEIHAVACFPTILIAATQIKELVLIAVAGNMISMKKKAKTWKNMYLSKVSTQLRRNKEMVS